MGVYQKVYVGAFFEVKPNKEPRWDQEPVCSPDCGLASVNQKFCSHCGHPVNLVPINKGWSLREIRLSDELADLVYICQTDTEDSRYLISNQRDSGWNLTGTVIALDGNTASDLIKTVQSSAEYLKVAQFLDANHFDWKFRFGAINHYM